MYLKTTLSMDTIIAAGYKKYTFQVSYEHVVAQRW